MAVIAFVAGIVFWLQFRHLDAQENALNDIGRGAPGESDKHGAIEQPQHRGIVV